MKTATGFSSLTNLTHIGDVAFYNLGKANFSSLSSFTHIGDYNFFNLKTADFSGLSNLTHIGKKAFYHLGIAQGLENLTSLVSIQIGTFGSSEIQKQAELIRSVTKLRR